MKHCKPLSIAVVPTRPIHTRNALLTAILCGTIKTESGAFHYASDANGIVRAELAQRKFMQTLSQTFAQLSIGLAIFDRKRQLATFNPALLDITDLNFEFLSGHPTLDALLDRLRNMRMLPEPKDYAS